MPVIGLGDRVPGPVGLFGVSKNDARVFIFFVGVAPHVIVALRRSGSGEPSALEPGVLIGGVVDDQFDHYLQTAVVSGVKKGLKIFQRAIAGMHGEIVGDVVAVVAQRRSKKRQQPDAGDAELLQVVQLFQQALKISDAIVVGIFKRLDVQLINNGVFIPERIERAACLLQRTPRSVVHMCRDPMSLAANPGVVDYAARDASVSM